MKYLWVVFLFSFFSTSYAEEHDCRKALKTLQWMCKGECFVVNTERKTLVPLGAVLGSSNLNLIEAFEDLVQNCINLQTDAGALGQAIAAKNFLYSSKSDNNFSAQSDHFGTNLQSLDSKRGWLGGWLSGKETHYLKSQTNASHNFMNFQINEEFTIGVDGANPIDSCIEIKTNPYGKPKYIGAGKLLG